MLFTCDDVFRLVIFRVWLHDSYSQNIHDVNVRENRRRNKEIKTILDTRLGTKTSNTKKNNNNTYIFVPPLNIVDVHIVHDVLCFCFKLHCYFVYMRLMILFVRFHLIGILPLSIITRHRDISPKDIYRNFLHCIGYHLWYYWKRQLLSRCTGSDIGGAGSNCSL
jgi:hypothetical protein